MTRSHILILAALTLAVPAAALSAGSLFSANDAPCFSAGNTGYRLTGKRSADYTIRIDNAAAHPDLTLQLVDDPGSADFVLVDGVDSSGTCDGARTIRTIRLDTEARDPDLTIALLSAEGTGRLKIYAHSSNFTAQDAAALFAVMSKAGRKSAHLRDLAAR